MSTRKRLVHWFSLIRTRLTLWIIIILAVGLLAFTVTTLVIAQQVVNGVDTKRSQQDAIYLSATLTLEPKLSSTQIESLLNTFSANDIYLQYQNQQGKPIASSTNMGRIVFPLAQLHPPLVTGHRYYLTMDHTSWYIYGQTIVVSGHVQGYLIVARITGTTDNDISYIFVLMYSGASAMIAIIALLVWQLVRRTLRPLERLADSASQIAQTHDHALRVYVQGGPDEINSLGRTINGMLHSLEDAYQHMQQVNDLQRRFLADASHELRTPLTIMLSSLELMKKEQGSDPEFQRYALESIQAEAQRLARLTTRLLLLARTDANAPFVREPLLIVDLISEVSQQPGSLNPRIATECQGLEALDDGVVSGNADYLKQVLLVLLENAYKYTPDGGKVTIRGERQAQAIRISIADTGIGIAPEDLPRLFERFYRAKNAHRASGMGLGLAIAHGLIEQHGGAIQVESVLGQGSCFTISLPLLNKA
jgi:two-component system, OmpR family, sensor kinase